jgi:hypothetical protein
MSDNEVVKIVVFVPETHADIVRKAMREAGAGVIGDYKHCTFSVKGIGRFIPLDTANPTIGESGRLEEFDFLFSNLTQLLLKINNHIV